MKTVYRHLREIKQKAELQFAPSLMDDMVEVECHFKKAWISVQGWTVVPIESCYHFTDATCQKLMAAVDDGSRRVPRCDKVIFLCTLSTR
jgi:hypothetical protein